MENTCRICLQEHNTLISMFLNNNGPSPFEKLIKILKFEINDVEPSSICSDCLAELNDCVKFVEKCEEANRVLLSRCNDSLNLVNDCVDLENGSEVKAVQNNLDIVNAESNIDLQDESQSFRKSCKECGSRRSCEHRPHTIYPCQFCHKVFTRKFNYTIHLKRHTGQRDFPCPSCGAAQLSSWLARRHCARPRLRCPVTSCDRVYTSAQNLATHVRTHTGERPHICTVCGKGFTSKTTLTDHIRTHTGVKPYMCSVCGARFATNKLAAHLRTHADKPRVRPNSDNTRPRRTSIYACTYCAARYAHKQSLNRHLRKQHCHTTQISDLSSVINIDNQIVC